VSHVQATLDLLSVSLLYHSPEHAHFVSTHLVLLLLLL
jgi:hypothetical protein